MYEKVVRWLWCGMPVILLWHPVLYNNPSVRLRMSGAFACHCGGGVSRLSRTPCGQCVKGVETQLGGPPDFDVGRNALSSLPDSHPRPYRSFTLVPTGLSHSFLPVFRRPPCRVWKKTMGDVHLRGLGEVLQCCCVPVIYAQCVCQMHMPANHSVCTRLPMLCLHGMH